MTECGPTKPDASVLYWRQRPIKPLFQGPNTNCGQNMRHRINVWNSFTLFGDSRSLKSDGVFP